MSERRAIGGFAGFRRISWGAIFGGTVAALVVYFLLNLLGLGIGLGVADLRQPSPAEGIGVGAAIWWFLSTIIALFIGGWVAGRTAGLPFTIDSLAHGFITFGLFTIVVLYVLTTGIGSIVGGLGGMLSQAMGSGQVNLDLLGVGQAQAQAQNVDPEQARQTAEQVASAVSTGAILAFFGMLVGGAAAVVGGWLGTPRNAPVAEVVDRGTGFGPEV
jgi:hypothetical protein